jgi:hypothetical protein
MDAGNFEVVLDDNGDIAKVIELDPIPVELSDEAKLNRELQNLRNTCDVLDKAIEDILPKLYKSLKLEMPNEVVEVLEDRRGYRERITELESKIKNSDKAVKK